MMKERGGERSHHSALAASVSRLAYGHASAIRILMMKEWDRATVPWMAGSAQSRAANATRSGAARPRTYLLGGSAGHGISKSSTVIHDDFSESGIKELKTWACEIGRRAEWIG